MWNTAIAAMIGIAAAGILLADGEKRRVGWIRAMRRCLLRLSELVRYDTSGLPDLLRRIELRATQQERQLTRLLHACADRMDREGTPKLRRIFEKEAAALPGYGVLSGDDRIAFETLLSEVGRTGMAEQLRLIDEADEQLRRREEALSAECRKRAQLIRTLGFAGGAAAFLLLI